MAARPWGTPNMRSTTGTARRYPLTTQSMIGIAIHLPASAATTSRSFTPHSMGSRGRGAVLQSQARCARGLLCGATGGGTHKVSRGHERSESQAPENPHAQVQEAAAADAA